MSTPTLELAGIEKRFGEHRAVRAVSLSCEPGEILGLVGENGAGKSTLLNIIGGVLRADAGALRLAGQSYAPSNAASALAAGVAFVHQELNLFANLSVAENLSLSAFPTRGGLICRRRMRERAAEALCAVELNLDPTLPVASLSPGERQLVEIAKALMSRPRVLLLDEPTSSLTERETQLLTELMQRWKREGIAVVYVSHQLEHVLRHCDRLVVLRDGAVQAVGAAREFDIARLIPLMVGRSLDHQFPPRTPRRLGPPVLEARGLSRAGVVRNVSLRLRQGEILGIAGLMGAGRSELARMIFGLDARDAGEVFIGGQRLPPRSPRASVARGLAFASEDRRHEGLLLDATIADNMSLASLERFATSPLRRIDHQRIAAAADELVSRLSISCRDVRRQAVRTLSGGNQQKVVLARWLMRDAQVLLLDEPTRGVDVGSRQHVYELIRQAAARGAGVLLISSEIEELLGMCDRILVLSAGAVQAEFEREDFNRDTLMAAAFAAVRGRYS